MVLGATICQDVPAPSPQAPLGRFCFEARSPEKKLPGRFAGIGD